MSDVADRPRKKKKQKKSRKGLMIGLIGGGSALLIGVVVLIIVLTSGGGSAPKKEGGEGKKDKAPPAAEYVRPIKDDEALALLQKVGLGYHAFSDANRRGPKDWAEFTTHVDKEARPMVEPGKGWVDLTYNWLPVLLSEGASRTVVAYERQPYKGTRLVLFGDASTKIISEEDFAKAPLPPGTPKVVAGPLVVEGGKTRLGKYVRGLSLAETRQTLHNLGQCYQAYEILNNKGPKELADLDCARDALVKGALDPTDGWLEFIWGVGRRNMADPPRTILAYEREPVDGMRYVIFGNGAWDRISEEDFAKAPKAKR